MTKDEKIDFYERWIKALDTVVPDARGKVNSASIALTGKFIGIGMSSGVTIEEVESRWRLEPLKSMKEQS